jgi:hypothetical protein
MECCHFKIGRLSPFGVVCYSKLALSIYNHHAALGGNQPNHIDCRYQSGYSGLKENDCYCCCIITMIAGFCIVLLFWTLSLN